MNIPQYNMILRALVDFAGSPSAATADALLREVVEATHGFATPKFQWTFDETEGKYRVHNRRGTFLATVLQPDDSHEWLIYFPNVVGAVQAGSGLSFIEAQAYVESQF